jgi:hypothetical protein
MPRPDFSLDVVGADFPNAGGGNRRFEILLCEHGETIDLVLEPKNPADPNAVAVFSARGIQIGYLRADRAPYIGSRLRLGQDVQARFQGPRPWGASIRISVEGYPPAMLAEPATPAPPARQHGMHQPTEEGVDPDPGFWPDEVPPDE